MLSAHNIKCFGPSQAAAKIESSKAYAKEFMTKHRIPTANYRIFSTPSEALAYIDSVNHRVVVKASGLAAGKGQIAQNKILALTVVWLPFVSLIVGVVVPSTAQEAKEAIGEIMINRSFGAAGDRVVVEDYLEGEEASFLAFTDGKVVVPMPVAQDHKRLNNGDAGPNTGPYISIHNYSVLISELLAGGMGAFAPAPGISQELVSQVVKEIIQPAVDGMAQSGHPFIGVLYAGVILTKDGPRNLEFNCRFGDPETQALLPLLKSDLVEIALACVNGTFLPSTHLSFS